ncbi:cellulose binding domain-containing protein [Cohnella panacarvi]|uniref:cellulose binding domain-containing protein n=1 Tax=Cohnella panacarvi TaxID=400776 RepID=UPI00047B6EEA|nr:cellulose binding domain-containing protein [Cohnella panacarvi]
MEDIRLYAQRSNKRLWMYALLALALAMAAVFGAAPAKAAATPEITDFSFYAGPSELQAGAVKLQWTGKNVSRFVMTRYDGNSWVTFYETTEEGAYLDQGLQLNKYYQYNVIAYDLSGNVGRQTGYGFNLIHLFVEPDAANGKFNVHWTSTVGDDVIYELIVMKPSGSTFIDVLPPQPISGLSAVVTGLNYDQTYVFYLHVNKASTGQYTGIYTNQVYSTLYSQPFQLQATEGSSQVSLNWNSLTNTQKYTVKRATQSNGPYSIVSPVLTGTSFIDNTVQYGTIYYYIVTATSNAGANRNSNEAVVTPHPPNGLAVQYRAADNQDNTMLPFLRIKNFRGTPADLSKLKVRYWYSQDSATQDNVYCDWAQVGCANAPAVIKIASAPSPTANRYIELSFLPSAGSIQPGSTSGDIRLRVDNTTFTNYNKLNDYSYIDAQTSFADSSRITLYENGSLIWGVEPSSDLPSPPQNVMAIGGNSQAMLSWDRPIGATRYTVKRGTTPTGQFTPITPYGWTQQQFTDVTAQNGTRYYYIVTAANNGGESAPSAVVSAVPTASEPNTPQSLASISAQYRPGDNNATNNTINPYISLKNTGSSPVALSELKVRYYFTVDGDTSQNFVCDWAQVGCANVQGKLVKLSTAKSGADYYAEFTFAAGAGMLAPGASIGDIQSRIHKTNWGNYNETGDYSYDGSRSTLTDSNKLTIYQNDVLIWGIEP